MQVRNVLHAARWNTGCKSRQNSHLGTIAQLCRAVSSQLRHVSTIGKKLLNSNICSTGPHNMVNFGPLTAEICLPANFNEFCVLPLFLQWYRSPEANQTLHDIWRSPTLVHYIYIFGALCPLTEFCPVQNSIYIQVFRSPILAALLQGNPVVGVNQTLRRATRNGITELSQRRHHLYSAGRPSR